jgi:hypothetical protein
MFIGQLNGDTCFPWTFASLQFDRSAILGDVDSADPLLRVLSRPHDLAYELVLLEAVGKMGAPSILPKLDDLELNHHEAAVREAAKEAAGEIKERAGAKRN